jgi:hypothetical protein
MYLFAWYVLDGNVLPQQYKSVEKALHMGLGIK